MFRRRVSAILVMASVLLGTFANGAALAERRVALVIGNANYNDPQLNLANPRNDASDVAKLLRSLGFQTIEAIDAKKGDVELALARFAQAASQSDSALFYYAGHAMQFQGQNYLMPVDAQLENEFSVQFQMVSLDVIRNAIDRANGVKIMILDACRNNPLAERFKTTLAGQSRNIGNVRGLARIDKTQGMVVAYATAADAVALDGAGRNSPYTTALLKRMGEPGLEIGMMFRQVTSDVYEKTEGRQRPATYIDLTTTQYYLNQSDRLAWDRIKDSTDPNALRDFILRFPSSPHALTAKSRMDMFERFARERQEVELAWDRVKDSTDPNALRDYLSRFPSSPYAPTARSRIDMIDRFSRERRETEALLAKLAEERRRLTEQAARQNQAEEEEAKRKADEQRRAAAEQAAKQKADELRQAEQRRAAEQEAAKRKADEQRPAEQAAQQAAARARQEQEAAKQRMAEADKAKQTAAERVRQEQAAKQAAAEHARQEQAAKQAAAERARQEQAAKQTAAERARQEQEAARIREQERQALLEAAALMRKQQEAARQRHAEEQELAAKQAAAERVRQEQEAAQRAELEAAKRREREQAELAAAAAQRLAAREEATQTRQVTEEPAQPTASAVASLTHPPASAPRVQGPPANTPELIRAAQTELRRVGCFSGRENGALNDATREAVKKYLAGRGRSSAEAAITDEFISDVKAHRARVCAPARPVAKRSKASQPTGSRARRREAPSVEPAAKPSQKPQAAPRMIPMIGY